MERDRVETTGSLTLYRVLLDGTADAGNWLRAVDGGSFVELHY